MRQATAGVAAGGATALLETACPQPWQTASQQSRRLPRRPLAPPLASWRCRPAATWRSVSSRQQGARATGPRSCCCGVSFTAGSGLGAWRRCCPGAELTWGRGWWPRCAPGRGRLPATVGQLQARARRAVPARGAPSPACAAHPACMTHCCFEPCAALPCAGPALPVSPPASTAPAPCQRHGPRSACAAAPPCARRHLPTARLLGAHGGPACEPCLRPSPLGPPACKACRVRRR